MDRYVIFGVIALVIFAAFSLRALRVFLDKNRRDRFFSPFQIFFIGVFLSVLISFIPLYTNILVCIHRTLKVFSVDIDEENVLADLALSRNRLAPAYGVFYRVMFVVAPLLSIGIIASFFKNFMAQIRLFLHQLLSAKAGLYVFSDLNRESLALAASIRRDPARRRAALLFADAYQAKEEEQEELLEAARDLNAILYKKDILSVNYSFPRKTSPLFFFLMKEEKSNIRQAVRLITKYRERENTALYVFSSGLEGELLLMRDPGKLTVRRVNVCRSLILRDLYENGARLFRDAVPLPDGSRKIHAVIVGMGKYGTEMLKALSWYCQMDGYHLCIDAFGSDEHAASHFARIAPGLLDPSCNGVAVPGEAEYTITVHSGCDFESKEFMDRVAELTDATFAFVSLGSDEENIRMAAELRMQFERVHCRPVIRAVIYDPEEKEALEGAANHADPPQAYDIECVGSLPDSFSEKVILAPELDEAGLKIHSRYNPDRGEFWKYEYNYRSSVASALHNRLREELGMPGAGKNADDWTPEERRAVETVEHRRWNAYMRSEGYVYSGSPDKSSRNDLAKMHHNLVPFDELSEEDKRKDGRIASRSE
nr:hypothetical protein [Lachnospiraceae bacterium]